MGECTVDFHSSRTIRSHGVFPITSAEVVEKRSLTPDVRHVVLTLLNTPQFAFRPGQFLQCVLDARTLRQFSLASLPSELPRIEFCVDITPWGQGSRYIEGLSPGDRVTLRGPFGVFTLPENATGPLEFVATGAGIAPIRSMVRAWLQQGTNVPVTLTFGNRRPEGILYHEEWTQLAFAYPHFTFQPTLSAAPETWRGLHGRVTDVLSARADLVGRTFYLCGAPTMVDDARRVLASYGVPETHINFEKFT